MSVAPAYQKEQTCAHGKLGYKTTQKMHLVAIGAMMLSSKARQHEWLKTTVIYSRPFVCRLAGDQLVWTSSSGRAGLQIVVGFSWRHRTCILLGGASQPEHAVLIAMAEVQVGQQKATMPRGAQTQNWHTTTAPIPLARASPRHSQQQWGEENTRPLEERTPVSTRTAKGMHRYWEEGCKLPES